MSLPCSRSRHQRKTVFPVAHLTNMPLNLNVSSMIRRQKSDSCLRPSPTPKSSLETSKYDNSLLNVLFSNYELVATLADLDRESIISRPSSRQQMWNNSTVCNVTEQSSGDSRFLDLKMELLAFCREVFDAFHFPKDDQRTERPQSLKLSAYILRRDLRRCYSSILPLLEVGAALQDIIFWKNPSFTLLITVVFFYSILRGWTASLVLLLLLLQLTLNYLHTCRQIDLGLYFLPRRPVSLPQFDMSGAQVIFDVAKTVQRILNVAADISEKLNNLLNWTNSRVTFVFYCLIIYWLLLSLMFSTGTCLGMCAFTLGIRIFITSYLFDRFPKLCWRLDTYGYFYRNLPVGIIHEKSLDGDIKLRSMSSISRSRTSPKLTLQPPSVPTQLGLDIVSPSSSASRPSFAGSQSLISSEDDDGIRLLMDDVVTSRQCVLFEKKQFFPKNIVPGTLCLTEKCVAFHPKNISAKSNVLALFQDILSVKKITSPRTIGFMAGSRKSIELCLMNRRKSVQFLGVSDRDEFVETLKMLCMRQKAATHFIIDKDNV